MNIVYAIPVFLMGFGVCFCCMKAYSFFRTLRSLKDNNKVDKGGCQTMTKEQEAKFDKLIAEYQGYINATSDEQKKQLYREWLDKIIELKEVFKP